MTRFSLTHKVLETIIKLRDGEEITASQMNYGWVKELEEQKLLMVIPHGRLQRGYKVINKNAFLHALGSIHPLLKDLETAEYLLDNPKAFSRAELTARFCDSKAVKRRTAYGFMVNCYEPIDAVLKGVPIAIAPAWGSYTFIADIDSFDVPEDVIIVGIENMENFYQIREQRAFVEQQAKKILQMETLGKILFVARYPQNTAIREWMKKRENKYIHFGDYDLAGIHIYLSEFHKHFPDRSYLLIPENIESYINKYGSKALYDEHYGKFHTLKSDIPEVQTLIDLIHKYRRGLEQELFIKQDLITA